MFHQNPAAPSYKCRKKHKNGINRLPIHIEIITGYQKEYPPELVWKCKI
jgi:hypothetical protein